VTLSFFRACVLRWRRAWKGIIVLGVLWYAFPMFPFPIASSTWRPALAGAEQRRADGRRAGGQHHDAAMAVGAAVIAGLVIVFAGAVMMGLPAFGRGEAKRAASSRSSPWRPIGVALNVARPLQQRNGAICGRLAGIAVAVLLNRAVRYPRCAARHWTTRSAALDAVLGVSAPRSPIGRMSVAAGASGSHARRPPRFYPRSPLILCVAVRNETVATLSLIGIVPCLAERGSFAAQPCGTRRWPATHASGVRAVVAPKPRDSARKLGVASSADKEAAQELRQDATQSRASRTSFPCLLPQASSRSASSAGSRIRVRSSLQFLTGQISTAACWPDHRGTACSRSPADAGRHDRRRRRIRWPRGEGGGFPR